MQFTKQGIQLESFLLFMPDLRPKLDVPRLKIAVPLLIKCSSKPRSLSGLGNRLWHTNFLLEHQERYERGEVSSKDLPEIDYWTILGELTGPKKAQRL